MPRASVHARRDLVSAERLFRRLGIAWPADAYERFRARHRAIDRLQDDEDMWLHFMRGPEVEDAPEAVRDALEHVASGSWRALSALLAARDGRGGDEARDAAIAALADAFHAVRDSYSRGHAVRAPGPGGPAVVGLHAWEEHRSATKGFGLAHALRHDIRFEAPFARFAPEVPASDRAVSDLAVAIERAALAPREERARVWEEAWRRFVEAHVLPPGAPEPEEPEREAGAPGGDAAEALSRRAGPGRGARARPRAPPGSPGTSPRGR